MIEKLHDFDRLLDALSVGAVIGWIFSLLPGFATLLTVIWMLIRIWETETVKGLTGRAPRSG